MTWEAVIGVETHVELQTRSKMFCGCPVDFGDEPNTAVCPVCLGLPGALPVANEAAIDAILLIGAALDCELTETSLFYRKNYFYPDLPKNYQISQYTFPLCVAGRLQVDDDGGTFEVGITRVHMEEDTGKSTHVGLGGRIHAAEHTLLDFNRSGVPLVEIVTEPDIRSAEQARAYGAELQRIVRGLGVSDARLEEGSMRFDANVSVRRTGDGALGTRTEVKNVNSLRSLQRAIAFEIDRQVAVLEGGGRVVQETRHWNEEQKATVVMRSKEESEDYRYFQEPDLLPLHIDARRQEEIRESLPELPAQRRRRYSDAGADARTAAVLVDVDGLGDLFDDAVALGADPRVVGNWLAGEVVALLRAEELEAADTALRGVNLAELAAMTRDGLLSSTAAKEVLGAVLRGEGTPGEVAGQRDLLQVSDAGAIEAAVDAVISDNEEAFSRLESGEEKPLGFLVGQVMRGTGGKADPQVVRETLRRRAGL